jgi:hypothetical protein
VSIGVQQVFDTIRQLSDLTRHLPAGYSVIEEIVEGFVEGFLTGRKPSWGVVLAGPSFAAGNTNGTRGRFARSTTSARLPDLADIHSPRWYVDLVMTESKKQFLLYPRSVE